MLHVDADLMGSSCFDGDFYQAELSIGCDGFAVADSFLAGSYDGHFLAVYRMPTDSPVKTVVAGVSDADGEVFLFYGPLGEHLHQFLMGDVCFCRY